MRVQYTVGVLCCGLIKGQEADMEHIEAIIDEMLNTMVRDEYSQRQNDYCDGYEFALRELQDRIHQNTIINTVDT